MPQPRAVLEVSAFGNLLVESGDGGVWRICPEELSCQLVAADRAEADRLFANEEFAADWQLESLTRDATERLGPPQEGRCFCLKIPAVLGGAYSVENVGILDLEELIGLAGDIAAQVRDLPDGTKVEFRFTDA